MMRMLVMVVAIALMVQSPHTMVVPHHDHHCKGEENEDNLVHDHIFSCPQTAH